MRFQKNRQWKEKEVVGILESDKNKIELHFAEVEPGT